MAEHKVVEFTIPKPLGDFIFDLHQATRNSMRVEEVVQLYDSKLKEVTEKYFASSPWPEARLVANDCGGDTEFLLFYKEMITRHLNTKLKPQLSDLLESWSNYTKLFSAILSWEEPSIALTVQWINDILQEFVYQFQGFCQFRTQVAVRNAEELRVLEENRHVWNSPAVSGILRDLIKLGNQNPSATLFVQFGYFASVELGRLECLLGDYTASLQSISPSTLGARSEILVQIPPCYVNVFYHAGVCQLMLRRYVDAVETLSEIALHIHGIIKASTVPLRQGPSAQLQRPFDRILGLLSIAIALCPGYRVDDQVRELVDGVKFADKLRRMSAGDEICLKDVFEQSCPKFISPVVPEYAVPANYNQDAFLHQTSLFFEEAKQQLSVLKIRSYLRLYAAIDLSKLARISDSSEQTFFSQLLSYKHKTMQIQASVPAGDTSVDQRMSTSDVNFFLQDQSLLIESSLSKSSKSGHAERYFVAGVRKHSDIVADIHRSFARLGL